MVLAFAKVIQAAAQGAAGSLANGSLARVTITALGGAAAALT